MLFRPAANAHPFLNLPLLLAFCLTAFTAPGVFAKTPDAAGVTVPALSAGVDAAVQGAMDRGRLVGAVVIVAKDGRVLHRRAYGFADREARRPMREDALFRLASVSKAVTTMAAAALISQGKMALGDPVTRFLPDFTPALNPGTRDRPAISIRQIMSHTAGLHYGFSEKGDGPYHRAGVSDGMDASGITLEENLRRIASVPLDFSPGARHAYSVATDVLGAAIAKADGRPLPEAIRHLITGPLGMKDTGFTAVDPSRLTAAYRNGPMTRKDAGPIRMKAADTLGRIRFSPGRVLDPNAFPSGGAGMVGSADDILKLLEAIRLNGGSVVRPEVMREIDRNQIGAARIKPGWGFGLGWSVLLDPAASGTPESAGTLSWGGVYGHTWIVDPARGLSVVILTNTTPEGMSGRVVTDIRDAVYRAQP